MDATKPWDFVGGNQVPFSVSGSCACNVVVGNEQGRCHFLSSARSALVTVDELVCSFLPTSDAWLFIMPLLQLPDTNSVPTIQLNSDNLPGAKGLVLQRSFPMLVASPQPPDF